jgi:hypothetical protein
MAIINLNVNRKKQTVNVDPTTPVLCSLFNICIYDPTYRKNIGQGTRNYEYRICLAFNALVIPCSLLLVQYLHL